MECTPLYHLPVPGAGCGGARLIADTVTAVLEYEYRTDRYYVGGIRFEDVIAFRFTREMHSGTYCPGSYDSVVEVIGSAWVDELLRIEPQGILGSARGKRHFAVFLSNNGYFEAIADTCRLLESHVGRLP